MDPFKRRALAQSRAPEILSIMIDELGLDRETVIAMLVARMVSSNSWPYDFFMSNRGKKRAIHRMAVRIRVLLERIHHAHQDRVDPRR